MSDRKNSDNMDNQNTDTIYIPPEIREQYRQESRNMKPLRRTNKSRQQPQQYGQQYQQPQQYNQQYQQPQQYNQQYQHNQTL